MQEHQHDHAGRSTRDILDGSEVARALMLTEGMTVLDLGCGDGHLSLALSPFVGTTGTVHALDADEEGIASLRDELKRRGIENIKPILADAVRELPLKEGSIDRVLIANVLHGFVANDEVDAVLTEVNRVLTVDGLLAVVEFVKVPEIPGPPLEVRLSPEEVASVVTTFGFRRLNVVDLGQLHFLALFALR